MVLLIVQSFTAGLVGEYTWMGFNTSSFYSCSREKQKQIKPPGRGAPEPEHRGVTSWRPQSGCRDVALGRPLLNPSRLPPTFWMDIFSPASLQAEERLLKLAESWLSQAGGWASNPSAWHLVLRSSCTRNVLLAGLDSGVGNGDGVGVGN